MQLKQYNTLGQNVGEVNLADEVFGCEYNEALIHQAVVAYQANQRQGNKCTLTRSEVRGGGIKPWRQKGTGRARQGSIRAPQWIKGGVVFAPKPRDFSKKLNRKMRLGAFKSAISTRAAEGKLMLLDNLTIAAAKTKNMVEILGNFNLAGTRTLLVVTGEATDIVRASNNIPKLTVVDASLVNIYQLVANTTILATTEAIKTIEEAYKG